MGAVPTDGGSAGWMSYSPARYIGRGCTCGLCRGRRDRCRRRCRSTRAVGGLKAIALVLDVGGDIGECFTVGPCVVSAEVQFACAHHDAHVGLSAAAVASVGCGQRFGFGRYCHASMLPSREPWTAIERGRFATRVALSPCAALQPWPVGHLV